MYKYSTDKINIFIGLEDQKHFINEHQEYWDVILKLNHARKWVLATVLILRKTENGRWLDWLKIKTYKLELVCANLC